MGTPTTGARPVPDANQPREMLAHALTAEERARFAHSWKKTQAYFVDEPSRAVREADGLAMSSRNQYLSSAERTAAPVLYRALQQASILVRAGERPRCCRSQIHA